MSDLSPVWVGLPLLGEWVVDGISPGDDVIPIAYRVWLELDVSKEDILGLCLVWFSFCLRNRLK
jgi:hypothetical protein